MVQSRNGALQSGASRHSYPGDDLAAQRRKSYPPWPTEDLQIHREVLLCRRKVMLRHFNFVLRTLEFFFQVASHV